MPRDDLAVVSSGELAVCASVGDVLAGALELHLRAEIEGIEDREIRKRGDASGFRHEVARLEILGLGRQPCLLRLLAELDVDEANGVSHVSLLQTGWGRGRSDGRARV